MHLRTDRIPLFDEGNNVIGIFGITVDITEQKCAEADTYQDFIFVEDILFNLPGLIYWKNKKSQYIGFNKNVIQLSGLSREELYGKTDADLNWGSKEAESFMQDDQEVMSTGKIKVTEQEIPVKRKDGNNIILRTEKTPLHDKDGNVIGILGVAIDITDQKLLESEVKRLTQKATQDTIYNLDSIIASMPGYIYWKNEKSEYMGCNENLARISGLKNRHDIVGKTDFDFEWGKKDAESFIKDDQVVMQKKIKQVTEYCLPVKREDGTYIQVRTEKMPLYDSEKKIRGTLAIAVDVTDQKILEENLRLQRDRIEKLSEAKSEFIKNMEHDIRTPFSGVYSLTKFLEESEPSQDRKEILTSISQCAKELLDYCNGILDFSKIESKTFPIVDKKFDMKHLIDDIIVMEKPAAIQKKLELIFLYPENIPLVFVGDEYRIQRILINLLSNAIKFTHKGYVKIHVKIAKIVDNKNVIIHLYVQDTGIGIPKEKIDFIYEKFARISPSNEGKYRGVGLGLSIVKHLLDEIGGEIEVNSKPEEGTTFVCTFPLKVPLINEMVFKGENDG